MNCNKKSPLDDAPKKAAHLFLIKLVEIKTETIFDHKKKLFDMFNPISKKIMVSAKTVNDKPDQFIIRILVFTYKSVLAYTLLEKLVSSDCAVESIVSPNKFSELVKYMSDQDYECLQRDGRRVILLELPFEKVHKNTRHV